MLAMASESENVLLKIESEVALRESHQSTLSPFAVKLTEDDDDDSKVKGDSIDNNTK